MLEQTEATKEAQAQLAENMMTVMIQEAHSEVQYLERRIEGLEADLVSMENAAKTQQVAADAYYLCRTQISCTSIKLTQVKSNLNTYKNLLDVGLAVSNKNK